MIIYKIITWQHPNRIMYHKVINLLEVSEETPWANTLDSKSFQDEQVIQSEVNVIAVFMQKSLSRFWWIIWVEVLYWKQLI